MNRVNAPLLSVILTVCERTQYLEAAIRSVLAQTVSDLEVIVTDDADCETTRRICGRFSDDRRLRYRANSARLGALLNIGAALREARGEFATVLNDDDQMEVNMLEALLPPLVKHKNCVLSFGDRWMMNSSGRTLRQLSCATSELRGLQNLTEGFVQAPFSLALRSGILIGMGIMFRREALRQEWLTS